MTRMLAAIGGCGMAQSVSDPAQEGVSGVDPQESIGRLL